MEETFQSHLIDTTIFQTKSFDVLSEFALLISCATCSAYSAVLLHESEKMSQQNTIKYHLTKKKLSNTIYQIPFIKYPLSNTIGDHPVLSVIFL